MTRNDDSDGTKTKGKGESTAKPAGDTGTTAERTESKTYECLDCGHRTRGRTQPGACSNCGGEMKNLGVSSEQ